MRKISRILLSRSGIPDEMSIVPLGPHLTPGVCEEDTAGKLREKLLNRGLIVDIAASTEHSFVLAVKC